MLVQVRLSNETTNDPSKLDRSLFKGWGLNDLPLRASNEGLRRPRVARAQKIISLHPLLCSASKKGTWPLPPYPLLIHANNFIKRFFVRGVKCALRHRFTTFLLTSACVG